MPKTTIDIKVSELPQIKAELERLHAIHDALQTDSRYAATQAAYERGLEDGTDITPGMHYRARRAVYGLCGGSIPFGKPSKRNTTTVSAHAVVDTVVAALFNGSSS